MQLYADTDCNHLKLNSKSFLLSVAYHCQDTKENTLFVSNPTAPKHSANKQTQLSNMLVGDFPACLNS